MWSVLQDSTRTCGDIISLSKQIIDTSITLFKENKTISQLAASRIQHWAWTMASYKYTITWRNTTQHANADTLPPPEVCA